MSYTLEYDLSICSREQVNVIESRLITHGASIYRDPCYICRTKATFLKEENRDFAKKEIDNFLDIKPNELDKLLIKAFADSYKDELPQELMSCR